MNRKGYLLIEVIIGLSIFMLVAGAVTNGFLVGLKLYENAGDANPDEAIIATALINRIKNATGNESSIEMGFGSEKWKLTLKSKTSVPAISKKMFALTVGIAKFIDSNGKQIDPLEEKEYRIFRYLSEST